MTIYHDRKEELSSTARVETVTVEPVVLNQFVLETKTVTIEVPVRVDRPFDVEVPVRKDVDVEWPVRKDVDVEWPVFHKIDMPIEVPDKDALLEEMRFLSKTIKDIRAEIAEQQAGIVADIKTRYAAVVRIASEVEVALKQLHATIPDKIVLPKVEEEPYKVSVPEYVHETVTVQHVRVEEETRKVVVPEFVRENYRVIGKIVCTGIEPIKE